MSRPIRNWSGNQRSFLGGRIIYSRDPGLALPNGISLESGDGVDESKGCCLRLTWRRRSLIFELPPLIRPWRCPKSGEVYAREYGIAYTDEMLFFRYGAQSNWASDRKVWCCPLPWDWQRFRKVLHDLEMNPVWEWHDQLPIGDVPLALSFPDKCDLYQAAIDSCPHRTFRFYDFDGEPTEARTHAESSEWRRGTRGFGWLRFITQPEIFFELKIEYSKPVGPRKHQGKGTLGHGIELFPGELHEAAFRRYCEANNMKFIGEKSPQEGGP